MYIHHLCFRFWLFPAAGSRAEDGLMRDSFQFEVLQAQHEEVKQKVGNILPSPLNITFLIGITERWDKSSHKHLILVKVINNLCNPGLC